MDIVRKEFENRGIQISPVSLTFYDEGTAIDMILRCKQLGYKIVGIDSFKIEGITTQPFMEHSIDYLYSEYGSKGFGCWDEAIEFIKSKRKYGLVFDIFYNEMEY